MLALALVAGAGSYLTSCGPQIDDLCIVLMVERELCHFLQGLLLACIVCVDTSTALLQHHT